MKRAKILAALTYLVLVLGASTFMHYPDLQAAQAEKQVRAACSAHPARSKNTDIKVKHGKLIYS